MPLYENGCKTPKIPTILGPTLRCIAAKILLSIIVINATPNNIGTINKTMSIIINNIEKNSENCDTNKN